MWVESPSMISSIAVRCPAVFCDICFVVKERRAAHHRAGVPLHFAPPAVTIPAGLPATT